MSLLSRLSVPATTDDLARVVDALLNDAGARAPSELFEPVEPPEQVQPTEPGPSPGLPLAPVGLGTELARLSPPSTKPAPTAEPGRHEADGRLAPPSRPTGLGTASLSRPAPSSDDASVPELYSPPPLRDDEALGEEVNDRLIEWAEEVGVYPGKLDEVRSANVGRLIMLAHPESHDRDRLLAAAKCALAEWATDDHYMDDASLGADPQWLASRLVLADAVVDPAHLPARYAPELEGAAQSDPVLRAYRSALDNLGQYATASQMARLRHELSVMFVAYNQEGEWRSQGRTPPVWEYLTHRHKNSFLPCMVLVDAVGAYELPPQEFADQAVRRVFSMAGSASVLVNDLHSVAKEHGEADLNLPKLIAAEDGCSLQEAVEQTAKLHDELVHTVEQEAAALSLTGSPALQRFLAGVWAWLGGSREWHRTSPRYNASQSEG